MRLRFDASKCVVGRVVNEDDDFMLIEVVKNEERPLRLDPDTPDRFFTLAFVHVIDKDDADPKTMETWRPWEAT